jgi:carboxymethylenebutenolidase
MPTNAEVPTLEGESRFPVYCAEPDETATAAIIVIPEIFGLNRGIAAKCDAWAAEGYLAVAPDIFWRFAKGEELDPDVESEFNRAIENMGKFSGDDCVRDIEALIHWIRREKGIPKVGLVGFCLGGHMAYKAATRTDIDASVGYYGVGIEEALGEAHAIANPLMLHVPTADHFVSPAAQARMHEVLDPHPKVTLYDYEGLDHGFATTSGNRRDEAGARLADERTEAFFAEHLKA